MSARGGVVRPSFLHARRVRRRIRTSVLLFTAVFALLLVGLPSVLPTLEGRWPAWVIAVVGGAVAMLTAAAKPFADAVAQRWTSRTQRHLDQVDRARALEHEVSGRAGGLPRVRDVTDRALLGIHPAIPLPAGADNSLALGLPLYVPRDIDADLRAWVSANMKSGGFLLLVGPAAAGKSRSAYELVRQTLPDWRLFMPSSPSQLNEYVASDAWPEKLVIWLSDANRFFGTDGLQVATVRSILSAPTSTIILGTIRTGPYEYFVSGPGESDTDLYTNDNNEILTMLCDRVNVLPNFSSSENDRAERLSARDPRIAEAVRDSENGNIAEILAAAPNLINQWISAINRGGQAVITAAVVAVRCGHPQPLPSTILEPLSESFLTPTERARLDNSWFRDALSWARNPVRGQVSALTPQATKPGLVEGDNVSDVLVQYAELNAETPEHSLSDSTLSLLIDVASPAACKRIGDQVVLIRQRYDSEIGVRALRKAALSGLPEAMANLGLLLRAQRKYAESEEWQRKAVEAGVPVALHSLGNLLVFLERRSEAQEFYARAAGIGIVPSMTSLGLLLEGQGRSEEAEQWFRQAASSGYEHAMIRLGILLQGRGEVSEAEDWLRHAANIGTAEAWLALGNLLAAQGRLEEAEDHLRRAAEAGTRRAMFGLGVVLGDQGEDDEAELWFQKAAEGGLPEAMSNLALRLLNRGSAVEAEDWYRKAADAGLPTAMFNLAVLLDKNERSEEAAVWCQRAADAGHVNAMLRLAADYSKKGLQDRAHDFLLRAATLDSLDAMLILSTICLNRDERQEAANWWRKAANRGNTSAMLNLGLMLSEQGETVVAEEWWRKAAEAGNVRAMSQLGYALAKRTKSAEAALWYRTAAEAGDEAAIRHLPVLLEGLGRTEEAERWHREAVKDGGVSAMSNFGAFLEDQGREVEAEQWYERAAERGYAPAMVNLALMSTERGNHEVAQAWWSKVEIQEADNEPAGESET